MISWEYSPHRYSDMGTSYWDCHPRRFLLAVIFSWERPPGMPTILEDLTWVAIITEDRRD